MSKNVVLNYALLFLFLVSPLQLSAQDDQALLSLAGDYKESFAALKIPAMQLGYLDNLNSILGEESRNEQTIRFSAIQEGLKRIDYQALGKESQYLYQHLEYRLNLQLRRLELESAFNDSVTNTVSSTAGIYHQPLGTQWYQLFLDVWLSEHKTPEQLMRFGECEVQKVLGKIEQVRKATGYESSEEFYRYLNDDEFILNNDEEVIEDYHQRGDLVQRRIDELFYLLL